MEFTAQQIADLLQGTVEGSPDVKVSTLAKIEEGTPGSLTFLANPAYTPFIYSTQASVVIVNRDFQAEKEISATLVRVEKFIIRFVVIKPGSSRCLLLILL